MERCAAAAGAVALEAAGAGAFVATVAGRFAPKKYSAGCDQYGQRREPERERRERRTPSRLGGLRLRRLAHFKRINLDRSFDVLELGRAEVGDRHVEPAAHLTIGVLGEANPARLANAFQPRGDIDAVAHQVAVGLLDHVAQMNANAKLDAALGRQGVSGARRLHSGAVTPVVALQAQSQATKGRELSTLAPLRALRARTSEPAWARRAVDEGVRSCPRAGCGRSARPVVCPAKAGMFSRRRACRGKNQRPRSLDSRVAGNQDSEAYRQRLPWGGDESPGRNDSERKSGLESE